MSIRIRTAVVSGIAILALCAANSFGQTEITPSPGDPVIGAPSADVLNELPAPQNGDVQFQSDEALAGGGPFVISPTDESLDPSLDGCVRLDAEPPIPENMSLTGSLDSGGVMFNGAHPQSHFNGPVTFADRDEGQLDQLYMVGGMGGSAGDDGWFGLIRYDLLFGNNYYFTTAAGLDGTDRGNRAKWYVDDRFRYGWSMPQLFVEGGYGDLHVKFGHFYSPIGYEDVQAGNNFFITRSYAFQYGEPITQTGLLVSNSIDDSWSWTGGVVGGWNTFEANTRAAFVGGLKYCVKDSGSVALTLVTGDDSTTNQPGVGPFANRTMGSLVGTANLSGQLTYAAQLDAGLQQDAATLQGTDQAEWYGINQYLYYTLDECWSFGGRFEWFRDDDGFNVTGLRPGNPLVGNFFAGNFYETSLGLNYQPCPHTTFRPEVRYDWFDPSSSTVGSQNPFDDNTSKHQILYGVDLVLQY